MQLRSKKKFCSIGPLVSFVSQSFKVINSGILFHRKSYYYYYVTTVLCVDLLTAKGEK